MSTEAQKTVPSSQAMDELYAEAGYWHVNTGGTTIHAKRMPGNFRTIKWFAQSIWLLFFLGPYFRWNGKQAILWDIPSRQFHIFDMTLMPQDVWMLSLVLMFFAILLAVVTSVAGRVFCGYFCFQTTWTDVFTWIEEKFEGNPAQRRKLEKGPVDWQKLKAVVPKHLAWLAISALTGVSFAAWFTDAFQLWHDYVTLQAHAVAWVVVGLFTAGTYLLAGFMREQVCFWLCPYARIQGVMYDRETVLPAYDSARGEPRGKLRKDDSEAAPKGDCIDCDQCVAVCPTGIDIRQGQQEGCITCGLCIDACDFIMAKVDKPKGPIRYACLDELEGKPTVPLVKRPRVLVYVAIIVLALSGIMYGLISLSGVELKVIHERQPLFVQQRDGTIQNKYYLKVLNKTDRPVRLQLNAEGMSALRLSGAEGPLEARPGDVTQFILYARVARAALTSESSPIVFRVTALEDPSLTSEYTAAFFGPGR